MKLNVLKPSVNNMAVRVFVRAANLEFTEDDVYGKTRTTEFLAKNPAHLTPMLEAKELPKGGLWESCAIMQYLCNKHEITKFYPKMVEQRAIVRPAAAAPPRRPEPVEQHRARRSHPSPRQILRHPPAKGSREPARKMPERKHAGAPDAVLARPLSLASYPVATGTPLPGHQRPRARKG